MQTARRSPAEGYSEQAQPFRGYIALTVAFNAGMGAALTAAARRDRIPDRFRVSDIAMMAFATHKIARLVTKDSVTSFARAPFVRLQDKSGTNSLDERPRGEGLRRSVGELVSCPECTGQWVAGGLLAGMLHAPRVTRSVTALYTALALADLLQFGYAAAKSRA